MFTIKDSIAYKIYYRLIIKEILYAFIKNQALFCYIGEESFQLVLVINIISSHYNKKLITIYYKANILLAYLLPYFLDFNFIEILFSILKY